MFSWLSDIFNAILDLPYVLVGLLIESLNGWIMMLALLLEGILALLPGFPALPELPSIGGVEHVIPVTAMVAIAAGFVVGLGYLDGLDDRPPLGACPVNAERIREASAAWLGRSGYRLARLVLVLVLIGLLARALGGDA